MMKDRKDPFENRLLELRKLRVVSVEPLLKRLEQMLEDSMRQYNSATGEMIQIIRGHLVDDLEEGAQLDRWVSVQEASAIARRPSSTVRYWCRRGKVEARKVGGNDWEIDRESLYAFPDAA